jgi:hypothetical protein
MPINTLLGPFVGVALLASVGTAAAQQKPAPAPGAESPDRSQPAAKPPLKLRLNELDDSQRRSIVGSTVSEGGERRDAQGNLPGLGGKPSRSWDRTGEDAVPKSAPSPD